MIPFARTLMAAVAAVGFVAAAAAPSLGASTYKGGTANLTLQTDNATMNTVTGSAIVIWVAHPTAGVDANSVSGTIGGVADGNTYTKTGVEQATGGGNSGTFFRCDNATGGTNHRFTVTMSASGGVDIHVIELRGVAAAAYDSGSFTQGQDTATPWTLASNAFAQASNIVVCGIVNDGGGAAAALAESTGFTIATVNNDGSSLSISALAYKVVNATTALTPSWTAASGTRAALFVAAFKGA